MESKSIVPADRAVLQRQLFGRDGMTPERADAAKAVLPRLALVKDGQPVDGEPTDSSYLVSWGKRCGDARSGVEIVNLLHCLYPEAAFEWKD